MHPDKTKAGVLVFATIVAAMAFQAGVNPPKERAGVANSDDLLDFFYFYNTSALCLSFCIIFIAVLTEAPDDNKYILHGLSFTTWLATSCIALSYVTAVQLQAPPKTAEHITLYFYIIYISTSVVFGVRYIYKLSVWLKMKLKDYAEDYVVCDGKKWSNYSLD